MAIFGSLHTVRAQTRDRDAHSHYSAAFDYIAECATPGSAAHTLINGLAPGEGARVELAGGAGGAGGAFALPQAYMTKAPRESGFFESHLAYVDVQAIISGAEIIEVADTAGLQIAENLTPGKDLIKYALPPPGETSRLLLRAGDLAVLDPADAHMPCIAAAGQPALVRKVVVKIPVK